MTKKEKLFEKEESFEKVVTYDNGNLVEFIYNLSILLIFIILFILSLSNKFLSYLIMLFIGYWICLVIDTFPTGRKVIWRKTK